MHLHSFRPGRAFPPLVPRAREPVADHGQKKLAARPSVPHPRRPSLPCLLSVCTAARWVAGLLLSTAILVLQSESRTRPADSVDRSIGSLQSAGPRRASGAAIALADSISVWLAPSIALTPSRSAPLPTDLPPPPPPRRHPRGAASRSSEAIPTRRPSPRSLTAGLALSSSWCPSKASVHLLA